MEKRNEKMEKDIMKKNGGMDVISQESWYRNYFVISRQLANVGEALTDFEVRVLLKLYESSRLPEEPIKNVRLEEIAEAVGRSKSKVSSTLDDLKKKGLISITAKQRAEGWGVYNEYRFLYTFKDWWEEIGQFMKKEFRKDKLKKYKNVERARKALRDRRMSPEAEDTALPG